MLYAAKCYWPGVSLQEVDAARLRITTGRNSAFVGTLVFPDDDLVLYLFDATSQAAVRQASEDAGIPCERVMAATWLAAGTRQARRP